MLHAHSCCGSRHCSDIERVLHPIQYKGEALVARACATVGASASKLWNPVGSQCTRPACSIPREEGRRCGFVSQKTGITGCMSRVLGGRCCMCYGFVGRAGRVCGVLMVLWAGCSFEDAVSRTRQQPPSFCGLGR